MEWKTKLSGESLVRLLVGIGGGACSLVAGFLARQRPSEESFGDLLWLWVVGIALFLLAFVPSPSLSWEQARARFGAWLRANRMELAGLALLLLAALAVRGVSLETIPANLGGDEGTWGMEGLAMLDGPLDNPFATRWFSHPSLAFLAWGVPAKLFGSTVAGLRSLSVLLGTAAVLTTYLLARDLWGRRVAWFAAVALTFGHYHLHYSRLGVDNIADPLLATLALWLLVRALRSGRAILFALAGAVIGFGWYGYFGARLIGVIAVLYCGWRMVTERGFVRRNWWAFLLLGIAAYAEVARIVMEGGWPNPVAAGLAGLGQYGYRAVRVIGVTAGLYLVWRGLEGCEGFLARHWRSLLVVAVAAVVVAAPLLLYYQEHSDILSARSQQVSIFSGWLEREQVILDRSAGSIFAEQFWKSISAFNFTLDPVFWYYAKIPLLDFLSGLLLIVGLVWVTARLLRPGSGLLLLYFWLAVILGWTITENPPSSMRLIIVAPALALLMGLGLDWLVRLGRRLVGGRERVWQGVTVALLVVAAVLNLHYYFNVYTPKREYGNPTAEVGTVLSRYLAEQDDEYHVYFFGPPRMFWDFGTIRYMAQGWEGTDVYPPGERAPIEYDLSQGARFVFMDHRANEVEEVRAAYPDGVETQVRSDDEKRLLYVMYEVAPQ